MPDLIPRWELLLAASLAAEHRQRPRPYSFPLPLTDPTVQIEVWEGVYSPLDFYTWRFYLPHLPPVAGLDVLEVGCGAGVASLWMARQGARRVLATDILVTATQCVAHNAHQNGFTNLDTQVSDVFDGLLPEEVFDLIFWNAPWGWLPPGFPPERLSTVTVGNFDVGYQAIGRFLAQGPARLRPGGRLLMTAGAQTASWSLLRTMFSASGYRVRELARAAPHPPGRDAPPPGAEAVCLLELCPPA